MASNDHMNLSGAYEIVKHIMIDIGGNELQNQYTAKKWNIFRVPSNIRNLNEDVYTPQLVSIGPIHYGQERLNPMQEQKLLYLNVFRDRVQNIKAMDTFKRFLEDKEEDIRGCYYAEKLRDINKEKLVEMMLLDSVFIMELFLRIQPRKYAGKGAYSNDIIVKQPWLNKGIQRDLLLFENQIPFFILDELYNNLVPDIDPDKKHRTFIELARDYFDCFRTYKKDDSSCTNQETASSKSRNSSSVPGSEMLSSLRFIQLQTNWDSDKPEHFTDLIRSFYICKGGFSRHALDSVPLLRAATTLQEAGVSFETINYRPLLDIKFKKVPILSWFQCLGCIPKFTMFEARFEIPQLTIDNTTECVLSNIMALEQCYYSAEPYVCDYVSLFGSLIRNEEDINLFVEKEVIRHTLRSDMEVHNLVHGLCRNVVTIDGTRYEYLIYELNKQYMRMGWNRNMATLRLVYFRDLWRASSTIIGVVVFMFTALNFYQAIRGVKT